jgi:electron transfer flavoprotein alpha subunit
METILILVNTESDGTVAKPALEAATAACSLAGNLPGSQLLLGIVGTRGATQSVLNSFAHPGISAALVVTDELTDSPCYASDAVAAEAIARHAHATIVIAPATSRWNRVLPGVAHRLGGCSETHVTSLQISDGQLKAKRWFYRQRMEGTVIRTQRPWIILVDPGTHPPLPPGALAPSASTLTVAWPENVRRTQVVGRREPTADAQTIRPDAELLFVAGAGWTKKQSDGQAHTADAEQLILGFLRQTRASLGSSKSLVDLSGEGHSVLSFLSHMNQIGQTGATPRHPKGLATCCHGEEPHTVGWRFISERRAINLDPNCGWARGKADVLYVADAFEVLRRVIQLLSA